MGKIKKQNFEIVKKIIKKVFCKFEKVNNNREIIFVTGTDTGVGKTFSTLKILKKDIENGISVSVVKPIETGLENFPDYKGSDSLQFAQTLKKGIGNVNRYFFNKPLAPYLAARYDGRKIEIAEIKKYINTEFNKVNRLYVEGAGGLLVPICGKYTFLNLIKHYKKNAKVIIVAKNSLGTINHTLMTVEILKRKGIKIKGIVLNNVDNTQDKEFMQENKKIIEKIARVKVIAEFEYVK